MLRRFLLALAVCVLVRPISSPAQKDAKDHPLVSRFAGSEVVEYKTVEFGEFPLALGPIIQGDNFVKSQRLEGKITEFKYSLPPGRSSLEVERSYENALQHSGFQILYKCDGPTCRSQKFQGGYDHSASGVWCFNCEDPMRYLAAKLSRASGDVYVSLVVEKDQYEGGTWLSIIEVKPMQGGLVSVNASALANDIAQTGHASVYGIYFDTGKSVLKAESDGTLAEISKLLGSNGQLKLNVVGHTDNVGTLASNMTLSRQRADAVVAALITKYHVDTARLQAAGVGPLAPVATNKSEEGRAKNRRVELVEQ